MDINAKMLNELMNNYMTPVLLCDKSFCIVAVNDFITKNDINILLGQHIRDIFSCNQNDLEVALDRTLKGLPYFSTNFEYNLLNTTMGMFPVYADGVVSAILCIFDFVDIDEAIHFRNGSNSALISDRFRSPIAGIMNVSSILARNYQENEDYKSLEYLDHIAHCCYAMLNTSVSVQDYYVLVNSKKVFKMKKRILNDFLENICRMLQVLLVNSSFRLEFEDGCGEPITTEFDEDMISLAIFQIIANSCEFSPQGSTIRVLITRKNDRANIIISDEGIGIETRLINRVFDPFFSFHSTPVSEERIGIGLGLPIAKKIMEAHNGQIFITSEVNKGTTILLAFPIIDNSETELTLHSDTTKYVTDKFSRIYLIFSDICKIKFY